MESKIIVPITGCERTDDFCWIQTKTSIFQHGAKGTINGVEILDYKEEDGYCYHKICGCAYDQNGEIIIQTKD